MKQKMVQFLAMAVTLASLNTTSFGSNIAGNALQFDGIDDIAFVADNPTLDITGAITLEFWVKQLSRTNPNQLAVGKPYAYYIYAEEYAYSGNGSWKGQIWPPHTDVFTAGIEANSWYHLAMTYDGSIIKLYENGQLVQQLPHSGLIQASNYSLDFGKEAHTSQYPLHGLLDEVRLWNVARSEEEILNSYNRIVSTDSDGLVGYWNFDEQDGQVIYDATTNNNNGLLGNSSATETVDPLRVLSTAPIVPEPLTILLLLIGQAGLIHRKAK